MFGEHEYLAGFTELVRCETRAERIKAWRECMAGLARAAIEEGLALPLEGLDPHTLRQAVAQAQVDGVLDEAHAIDDPRYAVAAFEVASALPDGIEKRALGRLTLRQLRLGSAKTFCVLATRLAKGMGGILEAPRYYARAVLSLELGAGIGREVEAFAAAVFENPRLVRSWVVEGASGPLERRRFAARLLAAAAGRLADVGDNAAPHLRDLFEDAQIQRAWMRLDQDREPMVWRFACTARALLRDFNEAETQHILRVLEGRGPLPEKMRAVACLVVLALKSPRPVLATLDSLLTHPLFDQTPVLRASVAWGVSGLADRAPETALAVCALLLRYGQEECIEPLAVIIEECRCPAFSEPARALLAEWCTEHHDSSLAPALLLWLEAEHAAGAELAGLLRRAEVAFLDSGAEAAFLIALALPQALAPLHAALGQALAQSDAPQERYCLLRYLDACLLRSGVPTALVALAGEDSRPSPRQQLADMLAAFDYLPGYLVADSRSSSGIKQHVVRRLLAQVTLRWLDAHPHAFERPRDRLAHARRRAFVTLLTSPELAHREEGSQRAPLVALARATDALVRDEVLELSDAVLILATQMQNPMSFRVIAEASMLAPLEDALRAYASMLEAALSDSEPMPSPLKAAGRFQQLAFAFPRVGTPRVRALRQTLVDIAETFALFDAFTSMHEVMQSRSIGTFEQALLTLSQLCAGSLRRESLLENWELPLLEQVLEALHFAAAAQHEGETSGLTESLQALAVNIRPHLPLGLAYHLEAAACFLAELPAEASRKNLAVADAMRVQRKRLPPWIPPSRIVGGFYVLHALGSGSGGSVFAVVRAQDRDLRDAPRFALKAPEFSQRGQRALSEIAFLDMFRREASALLAMPAHEALARFVTFDAGAKPKPILVMELVHGLSLETVVAERSLPPELVVALFTRLADALTALHREGLAHLDIKPSNIILRGAQRLSEVFGARPVLVDFGLSGRLLRPQCGTPEYAAPEVWTADLQSELDPRPADVYALGCTLFEALTGQSLFRGASDTAVIAAHLDPGDSLEHLIELPVSFQTASLSRLIRACVAQHASARPSMAQVNATLMHLNAAAQTA